MKVAKFDECHFTLHRYAFNICMNDNVLLTSEHADVRIVLIQLTPFAKLKLNIDFHDC